MRSTLRGMARLVPFGILAGFLAVLAGVFLWQNHTTVSREGDFTLATDRDLVMAHHAGIGQNESLSGDSSSRGEPRDVAQKVVLRKRAGLRLGDRGHSAVYEAVFPEFPATSPFLRDVNRLVSTSHSAAASEFARADWSLVWEGLREPAQSIRLWEGSIDTKMAHASDRAICLVERHWEYTGGVHGNYCHIARCFVEENDQARELKLADLFEPSNDWEQRLVAFCTKDLRHQGASSLAAPEDESEGNDTISATLEIDDLMTFALTPSGLWFYFGPYQVGCYAEGAYSVQVPYSEIESYIPQHSPARLCMSAKIH